MKIEKFRPFAVVGSRVVLVLEHPEGVGVQGLVAYSLELRRFKE